MRPPWSACRAACSFAIAFMGPYSNLATPTLLGYGIGIGLNFGYFGTLEGLLGWSLGKRLLRVRVGVISRTEDVSFNQAFVVTGGGPSPTCP